MQKLHFLAVLQAATDETAIPLEIEAIEWAISQKHKSSIAFNRGARKIEPEGYIAAGVELKAGGEFSKHVLTFDPKDWDAMSLEQHHQVYQLIERIILGAQHMTAARRRAVIIRAASH